MMQIFTFILGLIVGLVVAGVLAVVKMRGMKELKREKGTGRAEDGSADKIDELRKQRIREELKKGGILSVSKVTDLLGISRATAFRYMEEMQQEERQKP